jgi:hypothetical protein
MPVARLKVGVFAMGRGGIFCDSFSDIEFVYWFLIEASIKENCWSSD